MNDYVYIHKIHSICILFSKSLSVFQFSQIENLDVYLAFQGVYLLYLIKVVFQEFKGKTKPVVPTLWRKKPIITAKIISFSFVHFLHTVGAV